MSDEDDVKRPEAGTGPEPALLSKESITEERHPELHPQDPADLLRKVQAEAADGHGVLDKARRALQEFDRDIGGEYERREDPTAEKPHPQAP